MTHKAIVLNSGGLDSTTAVAIAVDKLGNENVTTVSLYYGQAHEKELKCAQKIAEYYHVQHIEKDISTVMDMSNCALLKTGSLEIKDESYVDQIKENQENGGIVTTYVPFRNGLLLSVAAAIAMSLYPDDNVDIYYGAHADDAAGDAYADCTPEFYEAINKAIQRGTYEKCQVVAPFIDINKAGVVKLGLEHKVPFELTWSCYHGREKACGICGTCRDRLAAFTANGIHDPIEYETREFEPEIKGEKK